MRHGKQVRAYNKEKNYTHYDTMLNSAIEMIESKCPDQWSTILAYIDSESTIPPNRFKVRGISDNEIAREAFYRQKAADIFARLARLKEQDEIETQV